ncbi:MAG: site-2 protease family protein [Methanosarcinales archaeon]|nr:site-2 protease family protein [Methanosarcinales archaeon]
MVYSNRLGSTEVLDLLLSLASLTIAFAIMGQRSVPGAEIFLISALAVGSGFLLHELAHKFVAQHYGYWAEYQANRVGLIVIIAMALMGFIIAAPGAVVIRQRSFLTSAQNPWPGQGEPAQTTEQSVARHLLWISLAGPLTNIALMVFFLMLLLSGVLTSDLSINAAYFAFFINLTLAAFNLIPAGPLDGRKIYRGSPRIWALVAVPTFLLALPVYMWG